MQILIKDVVVAVLYFKANSSLQIFTFVGGPSLEVIMF